jgi:intracellular sulfur oxidation DsrE/DsrF family protein
MNSHDRRTFLAMLSGIAAFEATGAAAQAPLSASPIDVSWFDAFKGKHKQVFDLGSFDLSVDSPLRQPVTYLAAHKEISRLEPPNDINVICAISHKAFPMNAPDAIWEKYHVGEQWGIKDPQTGKPSVRNLFTGAEKNPGGATVRGLQARGIVFWQCNMALGAIAGELAAKTGGKASDIRDDLAANLLPGVKLVPAHTWAIGHVQERGFAYEKL